MPPRGGAAAAAFVVLFLAPVQAAPQMTFMCEDYGPITISPLGDGNRIRLDSIAGKSETLDAVGDGNPPLFTRGNISLTVQPDKRSAELRFPGYQGGPCFRE